MSIGLLHLAALAISFEVSKFACDVILVAVGGERGPADHLKGDLFLSEGFGIDNVLLDKLVVSFLGELIDFIIKLYL